MNIHIKNIGDCQKCSMVLSSFLSDPSKYDIKNIQLTHDPKDCDLLVIVGCLSSTQEQNLIDFFKKMPPAKDHRIISFGVCGSEKQDLFSFPENQNLQNRAIPKQNLADIIPIDEVIEGCPPKIEDFVKIITNLK